MRPELQGHPHTCDLQPSRVLAVLALAASSIAAGPDRPVQSQASFKAAIENTSTAPSYVRITVIDDRTKTQRTACTMGTFLMGAIHFEHGLGNDTKGAAEAERIALTSRDHVFHFSKPRALENVAPTYTDGDLKAIREKLAPLTTEQLRKGFSGSGELHSIYTDQPRERHQAYRDAAGCVLIERGLSPGIGDPVGNIWIRP